ncbi:MAG: sensor histidine kinase [Candidatus Methanoperedens sp.]|jgi:signal transduction histidine kinase|nr:sensor histidine kinase [Candidatus Methanoperedens sp.]PKL54003.1 MAG: ATP-binding protein [Candidatus Methanoperedenaceae archaeon HGW-Methanoperedenaceae-1]
MDEKDKYSIRPAGRHILTIGRDLIQDKYAAIVELVKNAYDADSPDVQITFRVPEDRKSITIVIEDHGHGMSRDTVINKWMVPSTDDKLKRKTSPNKRTMQGRKGVGRYAASILGNDLTLETVTPKGEKTEVYAEWSNFENADYLDNVEILVKTTTSDQPSGTILTITGDLSHLSEWDKQIDKLEFELKKLNSPISFELPEVLDDDSFSIVLNFDGFWKIQGDNISKKIEPYPIIDLYDYKISGSIEHYGKGTLTYTNQKAQNTIEETIPFDLTVPTGCGTLYFDIRVYDRDKEAIEQLIKRGLTDEKGNYVGNLQARNLLNEYNGIGVYRNGFRIRPLGDPDFDWLKLNKRRVQNPSIRIGSDQVIGYVLIQSEELSNLREKSARDGLRENQAYTNLKDISAKVIGELENRRFAYRKKEGLSRKTLKIETKLEKLFEFDTLKNGVRSKLNKSGVDENITDDIINSIAKKEEESNRIVEDIRQTVAIYQGQATLGKIVNVILHEGRKPLNFFKNSIPNFNFWAHEFKTKQEPKILDTIFPIVTGMGHNADIFVKLFGRLDPLAAAKRGPKKNFVLLEHITSSFKVFENEFRMHNITHNIDCPKDLMFCGWYQDIYIIMTNLIDNSIYWMVEKQSTDKKIEIIVSNNGNKLAYIDYRDSGPGIANYLIETEVIFEPEFTTKNVGSGLGLPIAGEAASRNGLELKAYKSDSGAYFRLEPIEED